MRAPLLELWAAYAPGPSAEDALQDRLRTEVAVRLRRACAHFDPAAFASLVDDVVAFKRRWAARDGARPQVPGA